MAEFEISCHAGQKVRVPRTSNLDDLCPKHYHVRSIRPTRTYLAYELISYTHEWLHDSVCKCSCLLNAHISPTCALQTNPYVVKYWPSHLEHEKTLSLQFGDMYKQYTFSEDHDGESHVGAPSKVQVGVVDAFASAT